MKRKGFTLIELLAVIVILAIIALIATPAVLNIIEDSRKGAAEASARAIAKTAETYYMKNVMESKKNETIDLSTDTLKYDGDQAKKGYIEFDNEGNASGKMYVGGYCVTLSENNTISSEKMDEEDCAVASIPSTPTTYKKYYDGEPVFYNPKDNIKCDAATSSATGTNDTCMKWYAFLDSEDSSTVNLILDHDTTAKVEWNSDSNGTTPDTVLEQLDTDVAKWTGEAKSSARLISASELNQIAPREENSWNISDHNTWYYFHTGNKTKYTGEVGSNTYDWLFDNTKNCTAYGCNVGTSSNPRGYWTSSYAVSTTSGNQAWYVEGDGSLYGRSVEAFDCGLRPVITISKSIFE